MFQTEIVDKIKTHILCSKFLSFFPENLVIYEIRWENIVAPDKSQTTIWCMRIAC